MYFAKMTAPAQQRVTLDRFLGFDGRMQCDKGAFAKMKNLSGYRYPVLSVRQRRGTVGNVVTPHGMIGKDCLIWVDGHTLYVNGTATGLVLTDTKKQMVSMGAYLIIWPDKKYINTQDLTEFGALENVVETTGTAEFALCDSNGEPLAAYTVSNTAPDTAAVGTLWWDSDSNTLKRYNGAIWEELEDVCVKLSASGIGTGFSAGDGVLLSGCTAADMDGVHVLLQAQQNSLVIRGMPSAVGEQSTPITIKRYVPEMDYVVECGNRLWGCKYGVVGGKAVNEIYASALGDFRNWNAFSGLSTDSYVAQRGSDGVFTGAAAYLGNPIFFKEDCMERVYISSSGGHQIVTVKCDGVKEGSADSLQVVDGTLYYHGPSGVYAFDGSMPVCVSQAWGENRYQQAVAGGVEGKYYLSVLSDNGEAVLFCYDTRHKLWYQEDNLRCSGFALCDGELFALTDSAILSMQGRSGTPENQLDWYAETGEWGLNSPENKYLQRLELRLKPAAGVTVRAAVSYDEGRTWKRQGSVTGAKEQIRACVLYIRPLRCTQLRLRLEGDGECVLYSAAAVYEKGSDVV